MAKFTRAEIRAIVGESCTEEMENKLVALHLGVVDPLKDDLQKYRTEAEKVPDIQKKLNEADASGAYKEKYEALVKEVADEKARLVRDKAARAYLKEKGITDEDSLELAMMAAESTINGLEVEDGKIKDAGALDGLVGGKLSRLVTKSDTVGAKSPNPADANNGVVDLGKLSMADYIAARTKKQ